MIVNLNLPGEALIQAVRFTHAVSEVGITTHIPRETLAAFRHLKQHFALNISSQRGVDVDCEMSHKEPFCRIGAIKRPLIFPRAITDRYLDFWSEQRSGVRFMGFFPVKRAAALKEWQDRATIEATDKGRHGIQRYWDERYVTDLGRAEFALCPNGGFPWSYRVIEACLLGATPVIQAECDWYDGMYFCKWTGPLDRRNVQENREWALKLVTLRRQEIIANLFAK